MIKGATVYFTVQQRGHSFFHLSDAYSILLSTEDTEIGKIALSAKEETLGGPYPAE